MSNGDFEVHPRGTSEELRAVREFVKEISELSHRYGINVPQPITQSIGKINLWYAGHNERYPNV